MKYRLVFTVFLLIVFACGKKQNTVHTVVISADYHNSVKNWLQNYDTTLHIINFYKINKDSQKIVLASADAIVITGGADINPSLYGEDSLAKYCGDFNPRRDSIDSVLLNYAVSSKLPLLGICRGLQFINVGLGGTLIPDIPTFVGDSMHRNNGAVWHKVKILPKTMLLSYCGIDTGTVYSNHHQAIDNLAKPLRISAFATDSVVEAIEWKDTANRDFLLAVQWHPEAMKYDKPLSENIAKAFINAIYKNK